MASSTEPLLSAYSSDVTALFMPVNLLPRSARQLPTDHWMNLQLSGLDVMLPNAGVSVYCLNLVSCDALSQNLSCSHTELLTISLVYVDSLVFAYLQIAFPSPSFKDEMKAYLFHKIFSGTYNWK